MNTIINGEGLPSFAGRDISSECIDFIEKCLQRDPAKRWNIFKLLRHKFVTRASQDRKVKIGNQDKRDVAQASKRRKSKRSSLGVLKEEEEISLRDSKRMDSFDIQKKVQSLRLKASMSPDIRRRGLSNFALGGGEQDKPSFNIYEVREENFQQEKPKSPIVFYESREKRRNKFRLKLPAGSVVNKPSKLRTITTGVDSFVDGKSPQDLENENRHNKRENIYKEKKFNFKGKKFSEAKPQKIPSSSQFEGTARYHDAIKNGEDIGFSIESIDSPSSNSNSINSYKKNEQFGDSPCEQDVSLLTQKFSLAASPGLLPRFEGGKQARRKDFDRELVLNVQNLQIDVNNSLEEKEKSNEEDSQREKRGKKSSKQFQSKMNKLRPKNLSIRPNLFSPLLDYDADHAPAKSRQKSVNKSPIRTKRSSVLITLDTSPKNVILLKNSNTVKQKIRDFGTEMKEEASLDLSDEENDSLDEV